MCSKQTVERKQQESQGEMVVQRLLLGNKDWRIRQDKARMQRAFRAAKNFPRRDNFVKYAWEETLSK